MREGWTYKKLGEVTTTINGLWTGKKPPFINVAVVRNTNFTKECKLDMTNVAYIDVELKQYNSRKLLPGDIIIEKSGGSDKQPVGRPVLFDIPEGEYSFSNFTSTLRINNADEIIPQFLHCALYSVYLRGETFKLQSKTTGIHNLDFKGYNRLPIPIPSLSEQQSIVAELDKINELISLKKAQLSDLDSLAQSIFYDMFGDPIENEKGWEVKKLDSIYKVTSSKRVFQEEWKTEGIPFYKVADIVSLINDEKVIPNTFITEAKYNELKLQSLVPNTGDILVTSRGTLGQCYIVKANDQFYFQDGMITWLSAKKVGISPIYIKMLFKTESFLNSLLQKANISTVAYLSINQLANRFIPLPPLSLQQEFAKRIELIEQQKTQISSTIKDLETLLASRMQYWFD